MSSVSLESWLLHEWLRMTSRRSVARVPEITTCELFDTAWYAHHNRRRNTMNTIPAINVDVAAFAMSVSCE